MATNASAGAGTGGATLDSTIHETWDSAVTLLHGSTANHFVCCGFMVVSATFALVGILMMTAGIEVASSLMVVSMLFLLSQAFTIAKLSRDRYIANMAMSDPTVPKCMQVFLPTREYIAQVFVFFIVSLVSALYSLTQVVPFNSTWYPFGLLALIWLLVASLCLSKSVRDRRDANAWASTTDTHMKQTQMKHVLDVCSGSMEYHILVWLAFASALFFVMFFIWGGWIELALERKGFLSMCVVFSAISCFHMAKLVRDRGDPAKCAELRKQIPFQAMVAGSFALSILIPLVSICAMNLPNEQLLFLLVGQLMTLNTTLNVAKTVRDKQEMQNLREKMSVGGFIV